MDSLDEIDIQEIEKLEKNKDDLAEKVIDFEKAFPDIEKWLKEFHRGNLKCSLLTVFELIINVFQDCATWMHKIETELNLLVGKIKGPVAKATRILHKRRSIRSIENDLYQKLKDQQQCEG